MPEHRYKLKYKINQESGLWLPEDINTEEGWGATDALVVIANAFPIDPDGKEGLSIAINTIDGRREGKELPVDMLFKIWLMMTIYLANAEHLGPAERVYAMEVLDQWRRLGQVPSKGKGRL
jgi:hypothetical protein